MPLKINFILPSVLKAGGVLVVLEYARRLGQSGHDAAIYYPLLPYSSNLRRPASGTLQVLRARTFLGNLSRFRRELDWLGEPVAVRPVPFIHPFFIRRANAVVATAWPTAYSVASFPPSRGDKFYFIQHYETWDSRLEEVDGSYRLPLKLITIAPWLTDLMREKFGRAVSAEIHNGLDFDAFTPGGSRSWNPPTLLMMHHESAWKGSAGGLDALRRIKRRRPEVRLVLFGMSDPPAGGDFLYHRNPSPGRLLELYRTANIFLSPSLSEGWGLPVMEAMACGCAVVATRTGCVPLIDQGDNLLAADPGDYGALEALVDGLLGEPSRCDAISARARDSILGFGWPGSVERMARVLGGGSP